MKLLFLFSIFTLFGITVLSQEPITIKTDKIEGIICTNLADWRYKFKGKELWIPTKKQVLEAEERIVQYFKEKPLSDVPDLWQKLPEYKRQYVGIVVDGQKRIFCNFYCSKESLSAKPYFVKDGGHCYFQIEYNVEDKKFYDLIVNGYA